MNFYLGRHKTKYKTAGIWAVCFFVVIFLRVDLLSGGVISGTPGPLFNFLEDIPDAGRALSKEGDITSRIDSVIAELVKCRAKILCLEGENTLSEARLRRRQIIHTVKALGKEVLDIYSMAEKTVEDLNGRDVRINLGHKDYVALFLTESDGRHLIGRGGEGSGEIEILSNAGAVSHMQIMRHMIEGRSDSKGNKVFRGINDIIRRGAVDPEFGGDTLEKERNFILKRMGFSGPLEWERIISDSVYAERAGIAIYLISAFELNRWRVVDSGGKSELRTVRQILRQGLDPRNFPSIGEFVSGTTGLSEGALIAGAYNCGTGSILRAIEEVLEGKELFSTDLPRETKRQMAQAQFFSRAIEELAGEGVLPQSLR